MWKCGKCGFENNDASSICAQCGGIRSAGRFNNPAPLQTAPNYAAPVTRTPASVIDLDDSPDLSSVHDGGFFRILGIILASLGFLIAALLSVLQYDTLSPVLLNLFFKDTETLSAFISIPVYALLSLFAASLCALPGIFLFSMGKLFHRLARMEELL